ncbi:ParB family chromosome partitioning protein [Hasllibacter halocynthiae]|uniref:ParB family chromosome partitioning protein n=1 Tax=Hasllibacter halocynthiae TaxID=595589 RepID=A0A2T0WZJ7_9RHOB|nr:ParB/RepB/Spo0J family partition protein [Hasllibacter halocynthiae]PRY92014.1 ParB family chromosome partitioning protein [Hasllibacter halocynthiae]
MSRHSDVYGNLDIGEEAGKGRGGARFLKRANALDARVSGTLEEKTLHWVDPALCRMWEGHNREYDLLTEARCRDLIDGIRAQGRQEFPAIVRATGEEGAPYEVICGARRHFAVSWLRANGYAQFKYLVEVRDLSDEEAFRLADIENRDREDISDFERARDYAKAVKLYYGGEQKRMAERLEVSPAWLSRYLQLAKLPRAVVEAYADLTHLKERHARALAPLLKADPARQAVLDEAEGLRAVQAMRREDGKPLLDGAAVLLRLQKAGKGGGAPAAGQGGTVYAPGGGQGVTVFRKRDRTVIELPKDATGEEAQRWIEGFLAAEYD